MEARFSVSVQTDPVAHPVSFTMPTGCFPGVKRLRRGADHPTRFSAQVKERLELYIYSPAGPSWAVIGLTLLLPLPVIYWLFLRICLFILLGHTLYGSHTNMHFQVESPSCHKIS